MGFAGGPEEIGLKSLGGSQGHFSGHVREKHRGSLLGDHAALQILNSDPEPVGPWGWWFT